MRFGLTIITSVVSLWTGFAWAEDAVTVDDVGVEAFTHPLPTLLPSAIRDGRILFRQVWLMPPARDDADFVGLGPVYNDISCLGCHVRNGRSAAPETVDESMHGMLVRLSIPGLGPHGGPNPSAAYGDQLNDHAVPGVKAEGAGHVSYTEKLFRFPDGATTSLRVPHVVLSDLQFGPLEKGAMLSARVAQPIFGLGFLNAIPEADIVARANRDSNRHGHANLVWNIAEGRSTLGRFGWKANQPTLAQQSAGAANGDMGLTSPLFPQKNCRQVQTACREAAQGPQPDLSSDRLTSLVKYLMTLAVPTRRNPSDSAVQHGESLFAKFGCAGCHVSSWTTGKVADFPGLSEQLIHPYTDLLVHDMGAELADGRPDFLAGGREWRTTPLWAVGLAQRINPSASFLHDGRARSLTEAILWHGGEANASRNAFVHSTASDRADLLAFLNDL